MDAALETYSADKLGIPDFALESAGKECVEPSIEIEARLQSHSRASFQLTPHGPTSASALWRGRSFPKNVAMRYDEEPTAETSAAGIF